MDNATGPHELLKVVDEERLDQLGRFFKAMLLDLLKKPEKVRLLRKMDESVVIDPNGHPESAQVHVGRGHSY